MKNDQSGVTDLEGQDELKEEVRDEPTEREIYLPPTAFPQLTNSL